MEEFMPLWPDRNQTRDALIASYKRNENQRASGAQKSPIGGLIK
jgi:hypothetical protein